MHASSNARIALQGSEEILTIQENRDASQKGRGGSKSLRHHQEGWEPAAASQCCLLAAPIPELLTVQFQSWVSLDHMELRQ